MGAVRVCRQTSGPTCVDGSRTTHHNASASAGTLSGCNRRFLGWRELAALVRKRLAFCRQLVDPLGEPAIRPLTGFAATRGHPVDVPGGVGCRRDVVQVVDDELRRDVQYVLVERAPEEVLPIGVCLPRGIQDPGESRLERGREERPELSDCGRSGDGNCPVDRQAIALCALTRIFARFGSRFDDPSEHAPRLVDLPFDQPDLLATSLDVHRSLLASRPVIEDQLADMTREQEKLCGEPREIVRQPGRITAAVARQPDDGNRP